MQDLQEMLKKKKAELDKMRRELFDKVCCKKKYHDLLNEYIKPKGLLTENCDDIPAEDASLIKAVKEFDEVFFNAELNIFRDGVPYNSVVETMENKLENIRIAISKIDWQ